MVTKGDSLRFSTPAGEDGQIPDGSPEELEVRKTLSVMEANSRNTIGAYRFWCLSVSVNHIGRK